MNSARRDGTLRVNDPPPQPGTTLEWSVRSASHFDRVEALIAAAERLVEMFVEVADPLIDDFDLIEFLQRVAASPARLKQA